MTMSVRQEEERLNGLMQAMKLVRDAVVVADYDNLAKRVTMPDAHERLPAVE